MSCHLVKFPFCFLLVIEGVGFSSHLKLPQSILMRHQRSSAKQRYIHRTLSFSTSKCIAMYNLGLDAHTCLLPYVSIVEYNPQVYHPNIDLEGNICLNVLREDWKPVLNISTVIYGLYYLFMVSVSNSIVLSCTCM